MPTSEIVQGAGYADAMNQLIVDAIRATGVANDGTFSASDVRDINSYIRNNSAAQWVALHGDDEDGGETGFHLVQNDGATTQLFGDENAVDTVVDGIFHLGFRIQCGRLLNEDGNENASLQDVAFWLNEFLAADLAAGTLANQQVNLVGHRHDARPAWTSWWRSSSPTRAWIATCRRRQIVKAASIRQCHEPDHRQGHQGNGRR